MYESRIARLLQKHGVRLPDDPVTPGTMSIREAAEKTGISAESLRQLVTMKSQRARRVRKATLDKIAAGLGVPRDVLERAALVDAGYIQAAEDDEVTAVLTQIRGLSLDDLSTVLIEAARLLAVGTSERDASVDGPAGDRKP